MIPQSDSKELNADQSKALQRLNGSENVFITGAAGSGKSFLLRSYLKDKDLPILASTGAAAILVGGRTFHSYFGLGIMEGGPQATVERAMRNRKLIKRLKKATSVVIDEISMISGPTLRTAEEICRRARNSDSRWGGIRIIAVGDFAQLPPVNPHSQTKEWAFLDEVWAKSEFHPILLRQIMRSTDKEFLEVLGFVREGIVNAQVQSFLESRKRQSPSGDFTRLFPHRATVEKHNLSKLEEIQYPHHSFQTTYSGKDKDIENFKRHSPIQDLIHLKENALVMMRQNDNQERWVNGSLGRVEDITDEQLTIRLLSGRLIEVKKAEFTLLDAEGNPVVIACNFPVSLAWAVTIHKAQGATLDRLLVNLRSIWEPGQAYVALSRVREPDGLFIEDWAEKAIFRDPLVAQFHSELC